MNKRLMVVEDNPDLLDVYQTCFENDGFEVVCAADGEEALQKFLAFKPKVVICDIKIPKLTGFDVIETISSYRKLRDSTSFIIMSAYSDDGMRNRAEQLGISEDRYLVKSQITLREVLGIIRRAFAT